MIKKRIAAVMIALSLTFMLGGCKEGSSDAVTTQETAQTETKSPMTEFIFRGSPANYQVVFADSVTVKIQKLNQRLPFPDPDTAGYYTATLELDAESASRIAALYEKYDMAKWNGFTMAVGETIAADSNVGFLLRVVFQNGEEMKAEGYERCPDGYKEFKTELDEIMKPYVDRMMDEFEEIGSMEYFN